MAGALFLSGLRFSRSLDWSSKFYAPIARALNTDMKNRNADVVLSRLRQTFQNTGHPFPSRLGENNFI